MTSKKSLLLISMLLMLIALLLFGMWYSQQATIKISGAKSLYQQQADKVCTLLHQALQLYQRAQPQKAYDTAEDAYWNVYDNILEIKYRPYVTPAYIFSVESEFHTTSILMKAPVTHNNTQALTAKVKALCIEMNQQAHYLEQHH